MKPAILLISPGILKWTDMDFGLPHMVSMGSYVEAHTDARVEILDLNYEGGDHGQLLKTIDELGPFLLVGLSCYSSFDYRRVMALAAFLREHLGPEVPLVTGGYHASALPLDLVFEGSPFDAVIQGEGERPLAAMVQTVLGGGRIEPGVHAADLVQDLDTLPPTDWSLLDRYWPRAYDLGRKLQVYLSRGCPYRCTFCMERSKSGYQWRAFSPERAVDELARLGAQTDLSRWVVNIADPLFGYQRSWRRQVLQGIVDQGLLPRAYWTLTRSDDLDEPDFELLGAARFSIGIGLESGSPRMLKWMQKGNTPERYLAAVRRLADRSHAHGITWAVNVIVGHPGETPETLAETHAFVTELFDMHPTTRGWLSIDPFRLYPGSAVAEQQADWSARFGTRFYAPQWWKGWYDHGFHAQHLDPSAELDHATRARQMHARYAPLVADISARFEGQGRDIDRVYRNSIQGQVEQLEPERLRHELRMAATAREQRVVVPTLRVPLGLQLKDPAVRHREQAVRRLLDQGVLRDEALIEALLTVGPEACMGAEAAAAVLDDRPQEPEREGLPGLSLGIRAVATALEALAPETGMVVAQLGAGSAWVARLLGQLVGPTGRILVSHLPQDAPRFRDLPDNIELLSRPQDQLLTLPEAVDRLYIGAALPRFPTSLRNGLRPGGRAVTLLGPRFRHQDLVLLTAEGAGEHRLGRVQASVLAGPLGWIRHPAATEVAEPAVRFARRAAPALCFQLLAWLELGADAANLPRPPGPPPSWVDGLLAAYHAAPGRLALHACALGHDEVEAWLHALETSPPTALRDAPGQALLATFVAAARAEAPAFLEGWTQGSARLDDARLTLGPALARLRDRMWQQQGTAPPLLVLDCPALGERGRATRLGTTRVVAVSLDEPDGHVLCQVLHEEMHALTDPIVMAEQTAEAGPRDTRQGTPGFAVHQALESVAVGATDAFLRARAPELLHDFGRWRSRVGA